MDLKNKHLKTGVGPTASLTTTARARGNVTFREFTFRLMRPWLSILVRSCVFVDEPTEASLMALFSRPGIWMLQYRTASHGSDGSVANSGSQEHSMINAALKKKKK